MSDQVIVLGVAGALLVFILWLLKRIVGWIKGQPPMTEKEYLQSQINRVAAGTDEERAYHLGKNAREEFNRKKGLSLWFWIILAMIGFFIYAQMK